MKKQILNHFIVGALALLTVIGLQSFDMAAKVSQPLSVKALDCDGDLIWFKVKANNGIDCAQFTLISTSALELHESTSADPLVDMNNFRYGQTEAEDNIECPTGVTFTCAVAYSAEESNFVEVNGEWVPQNAPVCSICRLTL